MTRTTCCGNPRVGKLDGWRRLVGLVSALALPCLLPAVDLPDGALPIEYLQGNGIDAYMNTGWTVCPTSDVIQVEFAVVNEQSNEALFCARENSTTKAFNVFLLGATQIVRWDFNTGNPNSHSISLPKPLKAGVKYTLTASNGSMEMDNGIRYDVEQDAAFTAAGGTLHLFCAHNAGRDRGSFGTYRLYSLKYWRSGELIHDCIPYRSAAGNVIKLWDRVEGTDVEQSGSFQPGPDLVSNVTVRLPDLEVDGTVADLKPRLEVRNASGRLLTVGEDYTVDYVPGPVEGQMRAHIVCQQGSGAWGATNVDYAVRRPVPAAYERLDYIQGDGASWLLTDYLPNPQTDVIALDFSVPRVETTAFLCARDNGGGKTWSFCIINTTYRFDYNSSSVSGENPASRILVDKKYTVTLSNNVATVSCDFKSQKTLNSSLTGTVNPLQFYAFYVGGPNSGNRNTVSYYKTYVCRAWRSGELIHEWVPVRRVSDNKVSLYDTVAKQFLEPLGTGAFIAGSVLPSTERPLLVADIPEQELTEGACTPTLAVTDPVDGHALTLGTDYSVAYADNDAAGVATATVTGLGTYAGASVAVPFTILHPLPANYERLAYIQGDGQTRLLTDWTVHPDDDRVDAEIALTQVGTAEVLWCARGKNHTDNTFTLFHLADGTFRWDNLSANYLTFTWGAGICTGVRYALRATNRGELSFGDRACTSCPLNRSFPEAGGPLMLFAAYYNGTSSNIQFPSTHRLYGMSVRRDGAPGRDWVPVKNASGVATLFDRVTGTTLTPLGSGAFIAGPKPADFDLFVRDVAWDGVKRVRAQVTATNRVTGAGLQPGAEFLSTVESDTAAGVGVVTATGAEGSAYAGQAASTMFEIHAALPEGYTRLRYVQGDGQTYLPTGVTPHPTTDRIRCEFELPDLLQAGIFCARAQNLQNSWSLCLLPAAPRFRFDYAGQTASTEVHQYGPVLQNRRYVVDVTNRIWKVSSGESVTFNLADLGEAGGPLILFAYYTQNGATIKPVSFSRMKLFGFRMYRSGELLHDWVPVLTSGGVATLYDLVDGTALEPVGPGLLPGPVVEYDPPPPAGIMILFR